VLISDVGRIQQGIIEICTMQIQDLISTQSLYMSTVGSHYYRIFGSVWFGVASSIELNNIKNFVRSAV